MTNRQENHKPYKSPELIDYQLTIIKLLILSKTYTIAPTTNQIQTDLMENNNRTNTNVYIEEQVQKNIIK